MLSVTTLTCPVCGAPFDPNASRCDYCGSMVVIQPDHPRIDPNALNKRVVDDQIARYRQAIIQNPFDATAHYGLGVAYFNLGLLNEAADTLAEAAHLMPENPHIQTQLAVVYADLAKEGHIGADDLAWDRLNRALRLRPNLFEALLLQADLQLRAGRWQDAVVTWRQAAATTSDDLRPPLRKFLDGYAGLLEHRSQRLKARAMTTNSKQLKQTAAITFLITACIGCTVFEMAASSGRIYAMIFLAFMIAFAAYRLRRRSLLSPYNVETIITTARNASSNQTTDVSTLLNSAEAVASHLHRLDNLKWQQTTPPP